MRRGLGVLATAGAALLACGSEDAVHPPEMSAGSTGGAVASSSRSSGGVGTGALGVGGAPPSAACAFSAAESFALPPGYTGASSASPPFGALAGEVACASGANVPSYSLVDVDGDGVLDLVFTRQCESSSVGTSAWWVFKGTGSGFASTAAVWPLPHGFSGTEPPFPSVSGALDCASGADVPAFQLVDMSGDVRPDIVVTRTCNDASGVGTASWWMFENTGEGFAASPKVLALPAGFSGQTPPFADFFGTLSCSGADVPEFSLAYMNDDPFPDLVITQACNEPDVGTTRWQVYAGSATGFVAPAISWTLPAGYTAKVPVFGDLDGELSCSAADAPAFTVLDIDGDGRLDLLVTQTCANTLVGASEWLAYLGTGTAFAASPTRIALPPGYVGSAASPVFAHLSGALDCADGMNAPAFALLDMNGDARPDLLVTRRCDDASVGSFSWLVYENTGTGFASATVVALPSGYAAASASEPVFASVTGTLACSSGADAPTFALLDMNGDLRPDLVVTERCADTSTGDTRWLVDVSTCK